MPVETPPTIPVNTPPAAGGHVHVASATASKPVPKWALHRRLYDWMLSFSYSPHATLALCLLNVAEAIFFPIPSVVLQIPLSLERPKKAFWYATVCTISCTLGGLIGYAVGMLFTGLITSFLHVLHVSDAQIQAFNDHYTNNVGILTAAAIVIHPFKLFTLGSGIFHVNFFAFVVAATIGRGVLFFGIAALIWKFGPPVRVFLEKYFTPLTVLAGVLLAAYILMMK